MSVLYTRDKSGKLIPIPSIKGAPGYSPSVPVTKYGAKGDGVTDDTAAFQKALAAERVLSVPGGTYVLSGTLVIRENCCLELSQDTILQFTRTEGNCIELRGSAALRGNHGILWAPYGLTGNVISMDTLLDGNDHASIPPYAKADPMWKRQRFVYDVCIIKPNSAGFNRSTDGKCSGTAIYMSATNVSNDTTDIPFMWGITGSGIRIAGGFSYGIHAINYDSAAGSAGHYTDDAWNHDMRIEAIIEGCEIGAALENCNGAHLNVTVQPNVATDGTVYAKHGVYLKDSRYVDMLRSRVWDWNADNSLWTEGGQYQHLALIGNCRGLVLDDFLVHETSYDIRDLICTDTDANFDTMTILQEPANKWFRNVDGVPKFYDGTSEKQLMLKTEKFSAEQAEFIHPADGYYTYTPNFTNLAGSYQDGYFLDGSGNLSAHAGYTTTDFIPIDGGSSHVYRIGGEGITWDDDYQYCRIAWFDSNKALKGAVMSWEKIGMSQYYPVKVEDETVAAAFSTNANVAAPNGAAYFRITAKGSGANLKVTIDETQDYTAVWHGEPKRLDESIHTKNDWDAREGEVGYIENRTHYRELTEPLSGTFAASEDGLFDLNSDLSFTVGETYYVTYNGTKYTCVAWDYEGVTTIGNAAMVLDGGTDSGEPFIMLNEGGLACLDASGAAEITVAISRYQYKALDRRYLPKMHCTLDLTEATQGEGSDSVYNLTCDATELFEAIRLSLPIYLRMSTGQSARTNIAIGWMLPTEPDAWLAAGGPAADFKATIYAYDGFGNKRLTINVNMTD